MENGFLISKKKDRKLRELTILCGQHRKSRSSTAARENKPTRSKKPPGKEEQCRFRFLVKYNQDEKQYFMFKEGCGCRVHNDHIRMKPHEIQPSTDVLTEKELKDVFNLLNHMVSSQTICALL